jgi:hypothetical protein
MMIKKPVSNNPAKAAAEAMIHDRMLEKLQEQGYLSMDHVRRELQTAAETLADDWDLTAHHIGTSPNKWAKAFVKRLARDVKVINGRDTKPMTAEEEETERLRFSRELNSLVLLKQDQDTEIVLLNLDETCCRFRYALTEKFAVLPGKATPRSGGKKKDNRRVSALVSHSTSKAFNKLLHGSQQICFRNNLRTRVGKELAKLPLVDGKPCLRTTINAKGTMTGAHFREELKHIKAQMRKYHQQRQGQKEVHFIVMYDAAPTHSQAEKIFDEDNWVSVLGVPKNMTHVLQPLDSGAAFGRLKQMFRVNKSG